MPFRFLNPIEGDFQDDLRLDYVDWAEAAGRGRLEVFGEPCDFDVGEAAVGFSDVDAR